MSDTQKILEKLKNIRSELGNRIQTSEANILKRIEDLKVKFKELEEENKALKEKTEELNRKSRLNSIVVFGLNRPNQEINCDYICKKIADLLGVNLTLKKQEVLKNRRELKGTAIIISHDLTERQRQEYRFLEKDLLDQRSKSKECFIRGNKLIVDEVAVSMQDLLELDQNSSKAPSFPATDVLPTPQEADAVFREGKSGGKNLSKDTTRKVTRSRANSAQGQK
ncbi:hypothetical protein NQ315_017413 [Exocentrus adspersus]|uniref:Uncharacterized protein n=1 Tax=Exocentrus adspersus TaxID=1586481 RepID=A0AAV8VKJ1_9CUCU|nr:hypothetical protein NQ315_017413 [Exocentrus adspersus]